MAIAIRKSSEIARLEKAGNIVAQTLQYLQTKISPGITLLEIDNHCENFITSFEGARPSFKGLYGFTGSVCTSVNEVCIHGVPTNYALKEGDIVGLDVGVELDGYFGDAAITVGVGEISKEDHELIECSKEVLLEAIDSIKVGMRFKELSKILEELIVSRGYVPLRDYCGHGIGKGPHEEPNIPNYLDTKPNQGPKIKEGMVFCLEPMICQKSGNPVILEDEWSVVSDDGMRASHYEHQVAIVDGKAKILTKC